ncbi:alpha/beta hydrolase [Labrys monachus]|uniref:Acetyl esterase/lipase n=1 Tax=Labrys monachus TaxID=217067 RepID=A0ABU0FNJ1_9HYPH|nr:alpha/beta hydrolase [Labrys monachus]MDQ0395595.1 acetyl esterase/lipase [Labrys monachus]
MMTTSQPLSPEDAPAVAAMRQAASAHKGETLGPEARPMFDAMLAATPAAADVRVEPATVGGIAGLWLRPANARAGARMLYIHGGGYVLGSAQAVTHFAGQIAVRVGVDAFVPDYRLAPEHPFPAAIDDAVAVYRGLAAEGAERIVVVGDSAGGGLALSLLSILAADTTTGMVQPVGAAVMSPWTDLALTGDSFETRAEADPIFTRGVLQGFADLYLQGQNAANPKASPLHASPANLPPIRIDVGDAEVLLSDSIRYTERARAAGVEITLSVWEGMPHVFQSSLGQFLAAEQSVNAISDFLRQRSMP